MVVGGGWVRSIRSQGRRRRGICGLRMWPPYLAAVCMGQLLSSCWVVLCENR